jgi:hypothetical protein
LQARLRYGGRQPGTTLIKQEYSVTFIKDSWHPRYILGTATFETWATLEIYKPWKLRLFRVFGCL